MKEWKQVLKLLFAAAVIVLVYDACIRLKGPRRTLQVMSDGERGEVIAERYLYGPPFSAVMVGSSMARRLGYGDDCRLAPNFYNLAIDGAGPLTGLALVQAKREKPRVVIVETDWLQRPLDRELIANATAPQLILAGFRQEAKPLGLLKDAFDGRLNAPQPKGLSVKADAPDDDPSTIAASLRSTIPRFGVASAGAIADIEVNAAALRQQVDDLQKQGVRVILTFLPMHPDLENAPAFRTVKATLHRVLPSDRFEWLDIQGRYHTVDSIHMTSPSGARFTRAILSQLGE
jgi:hypothetical protein